ncbi:MAG: hypothetical protein V1767_00765 [Chloroflexota bacterium]
MEKIFVDGIEYVPKTSLPKGNIKIVILQRGWVKIGRFYQDGPDCRLENCATIRNWGSTKGLGEIALGGPTPKTILDPEPTCRFHELTVICTIDCVEEKWKSTLS